MTNTTTSNTTGNTTLARLITDEARATRIADALSEMFEPEELAASAFEMPDADALPTSVPRPVREGAMGTLLPDLSAPWLVELHFSDPPDEAEIRARVAEVAGAEAAAALAFEMVAAQDWIATALEGLKPVDAGRFTIHGAHDRGRLAANRINIEIEAALAFGTGHHGTTRGCLLHFEDWVKRQKPRRPGSGPQTAIVDIGTGTGVLAFAAARVTRDFIWSGEMDPDSVTVARANARLNGVAPFVRPVVARGLNHGDLRAQGAYTLVFANILARPLKALAPEIARATAPAGELILSGLLLTDVPGVLAKYRAFGFHLAARRHLEGWASLRLRRGGDKPRKGETGSVYATA
jgi:ribosomal protein L11 methyltransferase